MRWMAVWGAAVLVAIVLLSGSRESVGGVPVARPEEVDVTVSTAGAAELDLKVESGLADSSPIREVARAETAPPSTEVVPSVGGAVLEVTGKPAPSRSFKRSIEHEGIQVLASVLGADGSVRSEYGATLDQEGKARIEFPRSLRLHVGENQPSNVLVRVVGFGWQRRFQFAKPATPGDFSLLRASLKIAKGITVPGIVSSRLSGRSGEAVNGAIEVYSVSDAGLGNGSDWGAVRGGIFGYPAPGRFELHLEASRSLDLWADAGGFGSGRLMGVTVDVDAPPDLLEIRVGGGAAIRGRLVTPAGGPPAVTELRLRRTEEHGTHGRVRSLKDVESVWKEEGRIDASLTSQPDGTFEFRGLRSGEYVLSAKRPGRPDPVYPMLALLRAEAHPEEVEIVLATPRIVVRLYDVAGGPWQATIQPESEPRDRDGSSWSPWPSVEVRDFGPTGVAARAGRDRVHLSWDPRARGNHGTGFIDGATPAHTKALHVDGGRHYLVTLHGAGFVPESRLVEVSAQASDVALDFFAPSKLELGEMEVRVLDPRGNSPTGHSILVLETEYGGVIAGGKAKNGTPLRMELPAGRYRVLLKPSLVPFSHGIVMPRRGSYSSAGAAVCVDELTEVTLTASHGGRLEVTVTGEAPKGAPEDPERMGINEWIREENRRDDAGRIAPACPRLRGCGAGHAPHWLFALQWKRGNGGVL